MKPQSKHGPSLSCLLAGWLLLASPLGAGRRAWAATLPAFEAPWINYFGERIAGVPTLVDIDGDGDLDLFVTTYWDTASQFLRNTGTAASPAWVSELLSPLGLPYVGVNASFGDIDADGDLDLFVGQENGSTFFFQNTGTATDPGFDWAIADPFGLYNDWGIATCVALADIDGDGDLDVFTETPSLSRNGKFFRNTGTAASPAFLSDESFAFPLDPSDVPYLVTFADIDGDGDLDGFAGLPTYGEVYVNENVGSPTSPSFVHAASSFGLAPDGASVYVSFGDIDADGDLDVVAGSSARLTLAGNNGTKSSATFHNTVFPNTGTATSPAFSPANPFGLIGVGVAFADIDADGDLDAFTADARSGFFVKNVGTNAEPVFAAPSPTMFRGYPPALGDLDGDGDLDVIASVPRGFPTYGSVMCWFPNSGSATSPDFANSVPGPFRCVQNPFGLVDAPGKYAVPALADIDGDGDLDLFAGTAAGDIELFPNTGSATSPAFASPVFQPFGLTKGTGMAAPAFVDVDRDGDLDLFAGQGSSVVLFYPNTGTATSPAFGASVPDPFGLDGNLLGGRVTPSFVDIDGDGDLDGFIGFLDPNSEHRIFPHSTKILFFRGVAAVPIFGDGFELGDMSRWSGHQG